MNPDSGLTTLSPQPSICLELPTYRCPRLGADFALDGDLGKPVWRCAPVSWLVATTGQGEAAVGDGALFISAGLAAMPNAQRPTPTFQYQPTAFRACWTAANLYLGFQCLDTDIWGTYLRRDDPLYDEEVVEAFLCPTGDVTRYYELEVSPRNVLFDGSVHSPDRVRTTMTVDTGWDCPGIRTAVLVEGTLDDRSDQDRWWSVEIAVPFSAFPEAEPPRFGDEWRANFYRIDRADPPEFIAWSPTLEVPPNFHVPERFGRLVFTDHTPPSAPPPARA